MRRRSRRRGSSWLTFRVSIVVCLLIVGTFAGFITPAASFTSASLSRSTQADVVESGESILNLSVTSNVTLGSTEQLVSMTNELSDNSDVTVELRNGSADDADLVLDGQSVGDSTSFTLSPDESKSVSVKVVCKGSLSDDRLYFDTELNATSVTGTIRRDVPIDDNVCTRLVYVAPKSLLSLEQSQLRTVTADTDPQSYNASKISIIGPQKVDLDGDSALEIPYVSNDNLKIIDENNETQTLVKNGIPTSKSLLWVGKWNGSDTAIYYANSSNNNIYRVQVGHDPTLVSSDAKSKAIAGAADIDSDASEELVYLDGSANVDYLTGEGGTEKTGKGVGSNNGYGIGAPADFDEDGIARIPIVTGSNNVALLAADGTKTKLDGSAEKTSVAAYDWDGDGNLEIIFLDKSDHFLKLVDGIADGTENFTIETATDGDGNKITAKPGPGVA